MVVHVYHEHTVRESASEAITFRATRSTANEVESRAAAAGMTRSAYVLRFVEEGLALERAISAGSPGLVPPPVGSPEAAGLRPS